MSKAYKWLVVANTEVFRDSWPSMARRKKRDEPCRIYDTADEAYRAIIPGLRAAVRTERAFWHQRQSGFDSYVTRKIMQCDRIEQLIQRERVAEALARWNRFFAVRACAPQVRRIPYAG